MRASGIGERLAVPGCEQSDESSPCRKPSSNQVCRRKKLQTQIDHSTISNYYITRVTLNTESDTLCLSRSHAQLTHFEVSDFGLSF